MADRTASAPPNALEARLHALVDVLVARGYIVDSAAERATCYDALLGAPYYLVHLCEALLRREAAHA